MKWLRFDIQPRQNGRKTDRWSVLNKDSECQVGIVYWYGAWRQFCFFPQPNTVFERQCLRDIAEFCDNQTKTYKENKAEK